MNRALLTDTIRTISRTQSRFFSIVLIVALGISFFAGMNATAPDMKDTAEKYLTASNAADVRIVSSAGLTNEDIAVLGSIQGVENISGEKFVDGILSVNDQKVSDIDGSQLTVRVIALDCTKAQYAAAGENDKSFMNRPQLIEGSWPTGANQCLVDQSQLSTPEEFKIGSVITVEGDGSDITGSLQNTQYTITGIIRTPLYISYERGYTTIGTGKLGTFIYVPEENFLTDYYGAVNIKISGSEKFRTDSEEYKALIDPYVSYISSISQERLSLRVAALKATYTALVAKSEISYATSKADIEAQIASGEKQVAEILEMAQNGDATLAGYKEQYNQKAKEASEKIDESKLEHSAQYAEWEKKRNAYNAAKELCDKYSSAETDYKNAVTEYNVATTQVNTSLQTVEYLQNLVATTRSAIDQLNTNQAVSLSDIVGRFEESGLVGSEVDQIISSINSWTAVGTAEEMSAYMEPQLQQLEEQLAASKQELSDAQTELANKKAELEKAEKLVATLNQLEAELKKAEIELTQAEKALTTANYDIQMGELEVLSQLSDMKNQITNYETNLQMAKEKAKTIEAEFEETKTNAYIQLDKAKNQLEAAKDFLLSLDSAKWYVSGRAEGLTGLDDYYQMAERTSALSAVFPWIFFIVAALVCLNSMTRMIDDERTQLGTLKAMGFYDKEIVSKYVVYSLSASLIGAVSGCLLGFSIFPTVLTKAFSILFDMPPVVIRFRLVYAVPGIIISVGVTVLASYLAAKKSLRTSASTLMRPKAPKGGKRVWLENFPALWSKLGFTTKVTFRNVFRNKKRFVMAVIGVMGCTALMVAGFGLNNSINATLKNQFTDEEKIWNYDMQIVLNGSYDTTITNCDAAAVVSSRPEISLSMLQYMKVFDTNSARSSKTMETYLLIPENAEIIHNFIRLRDAKSGDPLTLPDNGAIITKKLADELELSVGDIIFVTMTSGYRVGVPVSAIAENYAFHYVYMSKNVYKGLFGANPRYNYITANLATELSPEQRAALSAELTNEYEISAVSYSDEIQTMFENILNSIGYIVIILVVSAGLLSLIVMYNLSVMNINERVKEIATIKVLGFDNREVSAYIFRENILLSLLGTFFGLFFGVILHRVVVAVGEVDIVMFGRSVGFMGFFYAAVLSIGFSMLVNLILRSNLKKVDMVESLKSNE
ncbi:MAG: ABC transporter permease [Clostridia bacterium]|nr:ABC transporter permease [Clostridia bacterium]